LEEDGGERKPVTPALSAYVRRLDELFHRSTNKHEAHARSQAVLQEMAADPSLVGALLEHFLSVPGVLNRRHYPVIGIDIELNAHYGLVANCWIPLPDRRTDVSTKAIHHHGEMLLTTVTASGPGYEHWTFSAPLLVDPERELFRMELLAREPHPPGHGAFVDAYVPHLPLFPGAASITLALWSHRRRTSWKDHLKRLPFFRGREQSLRELGARLGLARALELKMVHYFDYYPAGGGFRGLRDRSQLPLGPNEDFLYSLFHVLQEMGQAELGRSIEDRLDDAENRTLVERLLRDLRAGRPIESRLSPGHFGQERFHFTDRTIARAIAGG
jgi:hypothetical protein